MSEEEFSSLPSKSNPEVTHHIDEPVAEKQQFVANLSEDKVANEDSEVSVIKEVPKKVLEKAPARTLSLCEAVKTNKDLNFKTPTSYLSSVLKKSGAVDKDQPLFTGHADEIWKTYLSKNQFKDVSESFDDGDFNFDKLKNGTVIVLEKSCFKEGTTAIYCDGKYFTTKFVKVTSLVNKVNSKKGNCKLGKGLRIVVEKKDSPRFEDSIASAY